MTDNPCVHSSMVGSHYSCLIGNQCMGKDYKCNRFKRSADKKLVRTKIVTKTGREYSGNKEELSQDEIKNAKSLISSLIKKSDAEISLLVKDDEIYFRTDSIESIQIIIED
jgi:hypothetical protein